MELIDKRKLMNHYSWWGKDSEKKKLFDNIVDQQPIVNAIPVDWIIKWGAEHMNELGTLTIERLLEDWEKCSAEK